MSRARAKFNYWRQRNEAIAADVAAALERQEIKLLRHARAITSIADAIEVRGMTSFADELRSTAKALLKID